MAPSDDYEEKLANTIKEFYDRQIEALRRAGVAKEKEKGLEIESTEAVRLFREATGYLLRLRELREDIQAQLQYDEYYNVAHILGHLDDYNRILTSLEENPSFKSSVENYSGAEYEERHSGYRVVIERQSQIVDSRHNPRHKPPQTNVPMDGSDVETFVLPRLIRVAKDVEHSIIGRCASGKRP